jgi:C1A family cysteine protease
MYKITAPVPLPSLVDLRNICPDIYDQGQLGSCASNAMGGIFQFEQMKQQIPNFMPSRLFIYYNTRVIENTVNYDSGATMRGTLKTMVNSGVCPETMWTYNRCFKKKPNDECYNVALNNQVLEYLSLQPSLYDIKQCLAQGFPVAFGISLYQSFMSENVARTGVVPMPDLINESSLGGHAVVAVGYDDTRNCLIMRNSWGVNWGDRGYFYLPYTYITPGLSADFWTIRLVEAPVVEEQVVVEEQSQTVAKPKRSKKNSGIKQ